MKVIWNWGMTASQLDIEGSVVGIDASGFKPGKVVDQYGKEHDPQGAAVSPASLSFAEIRARVVRSEFQRLPALHASLSLLQNYLFLKSLLP
jgi:hypothetical protein